MHQIQTFGLVFALFGVLIMILDFISGIFCIIIGLFLFFNKPRTAQDIRKDKIEKEHYESIKKEEFYKELGRIEARLKIERDKQRRIELEREREEFIKRMNKFFYFW